MQYAHTSPTYFHGMASTRKPTPTMSAAAACVDSTAKRSTGAGYGRVKKGFLVLATSSVR